MFSTHLQQQLDPSGHGKRHQHDWLAEDCAADRGRLPYSRAAAVLQLHLHVHLGLLQSSFGKTHVLKPCLVAGTQQPRSHSLRGGVATTACATNTLHVMRA
jgi:hypothetical protein